MRVASRATAVTLGGLASLHLAWAVGSSFPFSSRAELADAVVGARSVPSPGACVGVAVSLLAASAVVAGPPGMPRGLRRVGAAGAGLTLAGRGTLGLLGRTSLVSPVSTSPRFRHLDRRVYSPLCLALAIGSLAAVADAS